MAGYAIGGEDGRVTPGAAPGSKPILTVHDSEQPGTLIVVPITMTAHVGVEKYDMDFAPQGIDPDVGQPANILGLDVNWGDRNG